MESQFRARPAITATIAQRRPRARSLRFAGCATAAVAVLAGAIPAIAAAAAAPVTYYGCVNKSTGNIKIVSKSATCGTGERKISWNKAGPTGPKGDTGRTGPPGIVTGYLEQNSPGITLNSSSFQTVATLTLPSGDFQLSANVFVGLITVPATDTVLCQLVDSSGRLDFQENTVTTDPNSGVAVGEETLLGDTTVGKTIQVQCAEADSTNNSDVASVHIQAIPVSSIVTSSASVTSSHHGHRPPAWLSRLTPQLDLLPPARIR